jgi:hypothetical protein
VFAENSAESLNDLVNEAVDTAKSDRSRSDVMWQCALVCWIAWFSFWGMLQVAAWAYVLKVTALIYVVRGVIIALGIAAYAAGLIAIGVFLVTAFSLLIWRIRYRGLVTDDTDYELAQKSERRVFLIWLIVGVVLICPITVSLIFPVIRPLTNPFALAFQ